MDEKWKVIWGGENICLRWGKVEEVERREMVVVRGVKKFDEDDFLLKCAESILEYGK